MPQSLINARDLYSIRLIATDMDGTLTQDGKFTSALLQAMEKLATAGIKVLIVTGRSAGWVSGINSLMPIAGAIAENGGLFYSSHNSESITLTEIPDLANHRQQLEAIFAQLQHHFPHLKESSDNLFRLTDWTFDVSSLTLSQIQYMSNICQQQGWGFTYSNVQCHIKPQKQDKSVGLLKVLQKYYPDYSLDQIATVGDSPNDETLFDSRYFPISIGVANVNHYLNQLKYQPKYITTASEGQGFIELSQYILQS
ncbi:MAG: HAD family phosphatase [Nostocales cyanobacterium]|nr:MAG: HAD family phosphatase [Nostocales cyanobacterium]TAF19669.1 MAG: HAD family phosphatase [Nostocales cyanobacterium]